MEVRTGSVRAKGRSASDGGGHRGPHRRRGDLLESALLDAAWAELQSVGYADLSMEAVAVRADTSKTVLYRRWPNRAELILAALRRRRPMLSGPVPDTGSLREDVLALLHRVSDGVSEIGEETAFGLLDELSADPEGLAYLHAREAGAEAMAAILQAAAARGELRLDRIAPRVATMPVDLARHELLLHRAPVPDQVLAEIVDDLFLPLARCVSRPV